MRKSYISAISAAALMVCSHAMAQENTSPAIIKADEFKAAGDLTLDGMAIVLQGRALGALTKGGPLVDVGAFKLKCGFTSDRRPDPDHQDMWIGKDDASIFTRTQIVGKNTLFMARSPAGQISGKVLAVEVIDAQGQTHNNLCRPDATYGVQDCSSISTPVVTQEFAFAQTRQVKALCANAMAADGDQIPQRPEDVVGRDAASQRDATMKEKLLRLGVAE